MLIIVTQIFKTGTAGLEPPAGPRNRRKATAKILFLSMIPILQSCRKNRRKRVFEKGRKKRKKNFFFTFLLEE